MAGTDGFVASYNEAKAARGKPKPPAPKVGEIHKGTLRWLCTVMAITGHVTAKEVTRYTRSASQKVMAKAAMKKLARNTR